MQHRYRLMEHRVAVNYTRLGETTGTWCNAWHADPFQIHDMSLFDEGGPQRHMQCDFLASHPQRLDADHVRFSQRLLVHRYKALRYEIATAGISVQLYQLVCIRHHKMRQRGLPSPIGRKGRHTLRQFEETCRFLSRVDQPAARPVVHLSLL